MPSAKRVVSVRLDERQYEALSRFAAAMGDSRGQLIAQMVSEMVPVWEKLSQSVEVAKIAQEGAVRSWKEGFLGQLSPMELEADRLKDEVLQLVVRVMESFEKAALAAGGREVEALPERRPRTPARGFRADEPPSL